MEIKFSIKMNNIVYDQFYDSTLYYQKVRQQLLSTLKLIDEYYLKSKEKCLLEEKELNESFGKTNILRNRIFAFKEIINELENKIGKVIPLDDILKSAESKDISDEQIEEIIEKLKRSGDIWEPKRGFISKI